MADIELVIKIDDKIYKQCKMNIDSENVDAFNPRFATDISIKLLECLEIAVTKGTHLPKGHGRLVDADAITKDFNTFQESFVMNIDKMSGFKIVCIAPTIIEADKEKRR